MLILFCKIIIVHLILFFKTIHFITNLTSDDVPIWNDTCCVIVLPANKYRFSLGQSFHKFVNQIIVFAVFNHLTFSCKELLHNTIVAGLVKFQYIHYLNDQVT